MFVTARLAELGLGGLAFAGFFKSLLGPEDDESKSRPRPVPVSDAERLTQLEEEVSRLRLILRKTAAMTATLNYERVMDMVLDLGISALTDAGNGGAQRVVAALLLFEQDELSVAAARGLSPADMRVNLPGRSGVLGDALAACDIRLVDAGFCSTPR